LLDAYSGRHARVNRLEVGIDGPSRSPHGIMGTERPGDQSDDRAAASDRRRSVGSFSVLAAYGCSSALPTGRAQPSGSSRLRWASRYWRSACKEAT
jgi:hypothetical protein